MNNSKVTDHHAIIPTVELASSHLDELKSWEEKILFLIAVHTVMAMSKDHIYLETEVEVECQGECFKAKGKSVLQDGWKIYENCFKNPDRLAIPDPAQEMKEQMPKVAEGQKFYAVTAEKTEHYTSPPKPYSDAPYQLREDLAITYHVAVGKDQDGLPYQEAIRQNVPIRIESYRLISIQPMQEEEKVSDIWKRIKKQCEVSDVLVLNRNGEIKCFSFLPNVIIVVMLLYFQMLRYLAHFRDPEQNLRLKRA